MSGKRLDADGMVDGGHGGSPFESSDPAQFDVGAPVAVSPLAEWGVHAEDPEQFHASVRMAALDAAVRYVAVAWRHASEDLTPEDVIETAASFESYLLGGPIEAEDVGPEVPDAIPPEPPEPLSPSVMHESF